MNCNTLKITSNPEVVYCSTVCVDISLPRGTIAVKILDRIDLMWTHIGLDNCKPPLDTLRLGIIDLIEKSLVSNEIETYRLVIPKEGCDVSLIRLKLVSIPSSSQGLRNFELRVTLRGDTHTKDIPLITK